VRVRGEPLRSVEGARLLSHDGPVTTIGLDLPAGTGRATTTIHLKADR
jgi:hypothetical protein